MKDKIEISIEKAASILHQNDYSNCNSCGHRTEEVFKSHEVMQCSITCLTMCNDKRECIWYQKGKPNSKKLNLSLAKKRMPKGSRIYFSRNEFVDIEE